VRVQGFPVQEVHGGLHLEEEVGSGHGRGKAEGGRTIERIVSEH
jgi:hypothetical protein